MMLRRAVSEQAAAAVVAGDALDGAGLQAGKPRGGPVFFAVPRLLVGLGAAKCGAAPDCDSPARSPRSPLDRRAFPALGGSLLRSPRSPRSWDSQRIGLGGLVDTLAEPAADAKNRLLGSQMRPTKLQCLTKSYTSSPPKDCACKQPELGKLGEAACTAAAAAAGAGGMSVPSTRFYGDVKSGPEVIAAGGAQLGFNTRSTDLGKLPAPGSLPASIGGGRRYMGSVSATVVEQSEDYTCIIAHGPNPKTTHIFGDCILEPVPDAERKEKTSDAKEGAGSYWLVKCSGDAGGDELVRFCLSCDKKLDGGESCIFRGEKPFYGSDCRDQETLNEDEEEEIITAASSPRSPSSSSLFHVEDIFTHGIVELT